MGRTCKFKFLLTLLSIFFYATYIHSQWSIGFNGGINLGNMEKSNLIPGVETSSNTGAVIGGFIDYKLTNFLNSSLGIRYIKKGMKGKIDIPDHSGGSEDNFDYLEFPLYAKIRFSESTFTPFLFGGINLGYLLNAKEVGTINNENVSYDITEEYKKIDIASDIGIGLEYIFSTNSSYSFSINYSYGLKNIFEQSWGTHYHRGIQLLFATIFKL